MLITRHLRSLISTDMEDSQTATIRIARLKQVASDNLPKDSPLREVLLVDNDQLQVNDFLSRIPLWLRLLRRVR